MCDFAVSDGLTRESDEIGGVHQLVYCSILLVTSFTPSKQQETINQTWLNAVTHTIILKYSNNR